jgi:hypothetical protein
MWTGLPRNDTLATGARFLDGLDRRVLRWLLDDAERLNRIESRAIEAGYDSVEAMLDRAQGCIDTCEAM